MTQIQKIAALAACLLLVLAVMPAAGQEAPEETPKKSAEAKKEDSRGAAAAAYLRNLGFVGGRTVELAEAIPADKYGWRPMEGVRSVSESLMHMASTSFYFANRLGEVEYPEGVDVRKLEEVTDKEKCLALLRQSLDHLEKGLSHVSDPHAEADIFGRPGTVEDLMLISLSHVHEHFGQLIAYARSNQVVPPWSQ